MLLVAKELNKSFGGLRAISDFDFYAQRGDITGLIGPNGAGKTTFFNCVTGIYRPTSGDILFNGQNLVGTKPDRTAKMGIARTFQNIRLFSKLTVLENVLVSKYACDKGSLLKSFWGIFGHATSDADLIKEAKECLEFVGILHLQNQDAANLSYGDQRRLEIARALATKPKLIFLDEPTAGMNPLETEQAIALFKKINENGISIILIEHDMKVVMNCCDRIVVLDYGKKIAEGVPEEIKNDPKVIEAYLGKEDVYAEVN